METRQQQRNKRPNHQSIQSQPSFSGTTHTQRTHAVVEAEREAVAPIPSVVMEDEVPHHLPRLPWSIFERTAPVPSGELEIPLNVNSDIAIIKLCLKTG